MIHIHIARLEQAGYVKVPSRVQADTVLLTVELEFYNIQARRMVALVLFNLFPRSFVCLAVIVLPFLRLASLIKVLAHFPSQLNANHIW